MPLSLVLTLALALWPFQERGPLVRRSHVDGWALATARDRFTGGVVCRLWRGRTSYARGAVLFRFSPEADTSNAAYKVDNGPVKLVASQAAAPPYISAAVREEDLINPSDGVVRIPVADLRGGRVVSIEAQPYGAPTRFRIDGLEAALSAAAAAGCNEPSWEG
jgi:hypothetical protein